MKMCVGYGLRGERREKQRRLNFNLYDYLEYLGDVGIMSSDYFQFLFFGGFSFVGIEVVTKEMGRRGGSGLRYEWQGMSE